jgi:TorA maturation chaperone TorD
VYKALALGYGEPTLAYVDALRVGELAGGLREAVAGLSDPGGRYAAALDSLADAATACAAEDRGVVLDGLSVEFARLFTGPGRPAVRRYATQYLDRQEGAPSRLNGPATEYATAAYRAEGVAFSGDLRELPDLVTLELEFLYHLTCREEAAWAEGSSDEALNLQRSLGMFLHEHAVLWMPEFARAVKAATEGGLYAALADLLAAHVATEAAWLSSRAD